MGRVGVCCCGHCVSAGAAVCLRSVVWCSVPLPPPFVQLPVVLCLPGGTVVAALLFPVGSLVADVWCCPSPPPRLVCAFFFLVSVRWFRPPPQCWCPLLCFVVLRVVWCCGLWCVLCCARCCVGACAVLLGCVVLFLSSPNVLEIFQKYTPNATRQGDKNILRV